MSDSAGNSSEVPQMSQMNYVAEPLGLRIFRLTIYVVIFLLATVGNALVIFVVYKTRELHTGKYLSASLKLSFTGKKTFEASCLRNVRFFINVSFKFFCFDGKEFELIILNNTHSKLRQNIYSFIIPIRCKTSVFFLNGNDKFSCNYCRPGNCDPPRHALEN